MSQFTPRFQPPSSRSSDKNYDMRLRATPETQGDSPFESPYMKQQETQRIKNLSFWGNTDRDSHEEEEWSDRQSPTPFILGIIILVAACTLLWFLFQWASGDRAGPPPVISADTTPFKVRPENPGGMMIPHQDKLVYGRLSQGSAQPVERLLPPPEQPMAQAPAAPPPMPQAMPPAVQNPYPQQQGYTHPQQSYPAPQQQPMPPAYQTSPYPPAPNQAAYPPQPYPAQPQQPYPTPQGPYGQTPPSSPGLMPPPLPSKPTPAPDMSKPSSVEGIKPASQAEDDESEEDVAESEGVNELDQLIAKEAQTPLKRSVKQSEKLPKPSALDSSKYKVQIASLPSRSMAEQEMKRLYAQHGSFFAKKPWNIQKINLADRGTTHRLVVGSFANRPAALSFCKKLRHENIGCMVVPPATE